MQEKEEGTTHGLVGGNTRAAGVGREGQRESEGGRGGENVHKEQAVGYSQ